MIGNDFNSIAQAYQQINEAKENKTIGNDQRPTDEVDAAEIAGEGPDVDNVGKPVDKKKGQLEESKHARSGYDPEASRAESARADAKLVRKAVKGGTSISQALDEVLGHMIDDPGYVELVTAMSGVKKLGEGSCKKYKAKVNSSRKYKKMAKESKETLTKFDRLFNEFYEEDNERDELDELGIDVDDNDDLDMDDEMGEDEDVTITLTSSQVDVLRDILSQVEGDEDDEDEDLDDDFDDLDGDGDMDEDMDEDDDLYGEDTQHTNDGMKPGVDPTAHSRPGSMKTSEVAGDSLGGKSTGSGDKGKGHKQMNPNKHTGEGKGVGKDPTQMGNPSKKVVNKDNMQKGGRRK